MKITALKFPPLLSALWRKFHKLHLGLYALFSLMVYFGSTTAFFFEKYSLIDFGGLKTEWQHKLEADARGRSYKTPPAVQEKIFKSINLTKRVKPDGALSYEAKAATLDLSFVFLLIWLMPLYLHYFTRRPQKAGRIESRIMHLPLVLFLLGWVVALQRYFGNVAVYAGHYGDVPLKVKAVFAVSALLLGAFVSYLNLELTGLYIRARIARPFFLENNPYGLKRGFAISLTLRYALMMFSLAMVPLLLCLYLPVFSNLDLFASLVAITRENRASVLSPENMRTFIPIFIVACLAGLMLVFQTVSIFLYRLNVQAPVSALVRRMKAVAAGDFSRKTTVLYADEMGQLKGHFNLMVDGLQERDGRLEEARGEASRLESELAVSKATSDLAAQVAHDIRSPLAAMSAAAGGLELPAGQRELLENSARRIQEIADDLLRRYRAPSAGAAEKKTEPCLLAGLIEKTLAEKRLQYKDRAGVNFVFTADNPEAMALVEPKEFQRLISNLVNNAVEAFDRGGTLAVTLSARGGRLLLELKDDGKGIPPDILPKLGVKGGTHGKDGGTGLGLYHARAAVESWGGKLELGSKPGAGTTVSISLPAARGGPVRFAVLLDDDPLVHLNWKLAAKAAGAELRAFTTREDFYGEAGSLPKDTPIYIDSELGGGVKGEDIVKDLREKGYSDLTLATGHAAASFAGLPWLKVMGKEPPFEVGSKDGAER